MPPFATQRCWLSLSSAYSATLLATFLLTRVIISATLAKTWDGGKIFPPPGLYCLTIVFCIVPPGVCLLTKFTKWRHIPRNETDGSAVQQSLTLVKISCQHSQVDTTSITTLSHTTTLSKGKSSSFICKACGKEARDLDIRRHIEANHLSNVSHYCDVCGKTSRSRDGLRQHIATVHNN